MSKKILVIEDWDNFVWRLQALKKELIPDELEKHELKDVIEFEAEIGIPFWDFHLSTPECDHEQADDEAQLKEMAEIPKRFKLGENVKVFVVKEGK